jgi:hypothetical protein
MTGASRIVSVDRTGAHRQRHDACREKDCYSHGGGESTGQCLLKSAPLTVSLVHRFAPPG